MNPELEAIRDAMDKETGRDTEQAVTLADTYVTAHPDQFTSLNGLDMEQCVAAIDVFRAAGMEEDLWRVQAWILHRFEFQTIGGPVTARVRVPGSEN